MKLEKECVPAADNQLASLSWRMYWIVRTGHFLECYNATLYGYFAVILSPLFFPEQHRITDSFFYAYALYSVGLLSRPLGAIFWGTIGDLYGRKLAFSCSIIFSGVPPLLIGCLPTYDSIGILAPVCLLLARIAQGVFYGGEATGVSLYVFENRGHGKKLGPSVCYFTALGVLGAAAGAFLGAFTTSLLSSSSWRWRLPFLCGGLLTLGMYFVRHYVIETSEYQGIVKNSPENKKISSKENWMKLLRDYYPIILLTALLSGLCISLLSCATVFSNSLFKIRGYSEMESLLLDGMALVADAGFIVLFGWCSEWIGLKKQIFLGLVMAFTAPVLGFYVISGDTISIPQLMLFLGMLTAAGASFAGTSLLYAVSLFPVRIRYSGAALGSNLGACIIGGNSAIAFEFLKDQLGNMGPAFFLSGLALVTMIVWFSVSFKRTFSYGPEYPEHTHAAPQDPPF